jgi:phosphatidylglycerophosphate synthase
MNKPKRQKLFSIQNIPNLFTGTRVFLTIIIACILLREEKDGSILAGILLIIAWATDWIDGFLARRLGNVTLFGTCFDLLSDRLLMTTVSIISVILGYWQRTASLMPFNPFPYIAIVWAADFTLVLGIVIFFIKNSTRAYIFPTPTLIAKIAFPVQLLTLIVAILGIGPDIFLTALMYITIVFTLIGSYSYLRKGGYIFTD